MDAHLRDLRYFGAVAEELSFTRAAERLHVSQPALSKQIRALEAALHVRLLDRDSRRVSLTAAGAVLHTAAQQVLRDWDAAVAATAAAAAEQAALLRVGILTGIGRDLFPAVLAQFAARWPGWRVELKNLRLGRHHRRPRRGDHPRRRRTALRRRTAAAPRDLRSAGRLPHHPHQLPGAPLTGDRRNVPGCRATPASAGDGVGARRPAAEPGRRL